MLLHLALNHTKQVQRACVSSASRLFNNIQSAGALKLSSLTTTRTSARQYSSFSFKFNTPELNRKKHLLVVNSTNSIPYLGNYSRKMSTTQVNLKLVQSYENIIKPEQDSRAYRGLLLDNGLKCLLISDPNTDRAAASVDVHAGYMLDPKEFPGLAHFCEHMLFMGSKKVGTLFYISQ